MKIVGLTGGIGSGKTTAAKMFGLLGAMIYYTDLHSKRIINNTPQVKQAIIDYYGGELLDLESGNINGAMLADIVFNDAIKLAYLNNLMFPYIMKDFNEFCKIWKDSEYCIIESAILVDCGADKLVDFVINVSCPEDIRIQRAMARDGRTKEQVIAKINNQVQEDVRMNAADWIIWNSGTDTEYLQQQVNQVHKELLAK